MKKNFIITLHSHYAVVVVVVLVTVEFSIKIKHYIMFTFKRNYTQPTKRMGNDVNICIN